MQAKIYRTIDLLEQFGNDLHFPYTEKIKGEKYKDLWELRIQQSNYIFRIFYFVYLTNKCILLHGFIKKTNKTPTKELDIALNRLNDFLSRRKK